MTSYKSVEGNIRFMDRKTGVLLGDTMVKLKHHLPSERMRQNLAIRLPSEM